MIRDNKRDSHWLATFTYGYPQHQLEKQFCNEISNLNRSSIAPRMVIGDLNEQISSD